MTDDTLMTTDAMSVSDALLAAWTAGYHDRDAEIERLRHELAEKDDYIRTVSRPIGAHSYD